MKQHIKRSPILIFALVLLGAIAVYAASLLFKAGTTYNIGVGHVTVFEFTDVNPFTGEANLAPGDSMTIYPKITSTATVPMYAYMVVRMPSTGSAGLYEITPGGGWSEVDSFAADGVWVKAFEYGLLEPDENTGDAGWTVTMSSISNKEYAGIDDLNYSVTGYGIGTDDEELENAWSDLKETYLGY